MVQPATTSILEQISIRGIAGNVIVSSIPLPGTNIRRRHLGKFLTLRCGTTAIIHHCFVVERMHYCYRGRRMNSGSKQADGHYRKILRSHLQTILTSSTNEVYAFHSVYGSIYNAYIFRLHSFIYKISLPLFHPLLIFKTHFTACYSIVLGTSRQSLDGNLRSYKRSAINWRIKFTLLFHKLSEILVRIDI